MAVVEEQLALARSAVRAARARRPVVPTVPAAELPVARVVLDLPLPHLDRPFDYLVPESMSAAAQPGVRVRVRLAGQQLGGFVIARAESSEHSGALTPLTKVVSSERVLTSPVLRLCRAVADRYAGTLADVLRLAVPPRHARVEAEQPKAATPGSVTSVAPAASRADSPSETALAVSTPEPGAAGSRGVAPASVVRAATSEARPTRHQATVATAPLAPMRTTAAATVAGARIWARYEGGAAWLAALRRGDHPRALWCALPGVEWPAELAAAAAATLAGDRGVVIVVPDRRDVDRVDAALRQALDGGQHVAITAELGPAERYRRWLAVRRGAVRVVVGTRAAVFAPVQRLGLVAVWDDGDDLHAEPRAPYPHVREVALLRAHLEHCAVLVGGFARTAEGAALVESGWACDLSAARAVVRQRAARVRTIGDRDLARDPAARAARLPQFAWEAARDGLARGPVLVQVPRAGYVPALACQRCREPARCSACAGPLRLRAGGSDPSCGWCARPATEWRCSTCGSARLRASRVGSVRTAEELGRAFPGTVVRSSAGDAVLASVPGDPALVVATPGAEPVAVGGYAAALLLDGDTLLARDDLRGAEEAVRRWMAAAALVRPADEGGVVALVANPRAPAVQAVLRWDPGGFAERELAGRAAARFPPAVRLATVTGEPSAVAELIAGAALPAAAEVLGPAAAPQHDKPDSVRAVVRVPVRHGTALSAALQSAQAGRSARKAGGNVTVRIDPSELG